MDIISTYFPDEYIGSFIRRNKELQCEYKFSKNDYETQRISFRDKDNTEILPRSIRQICDQERVLTDTTLHPIAKKLGILKKITTVITPTEKWSICEQCVTEDIESVGVAYIHRQHIVPGLTVCYKHAGPLKSVCIACSTAIKWHHITGFYQCHKSYAPLKYDNAPTPHHFQLSEFSADLISIDITHVPNVNSKKLIRQRLCELGYGKIENIDYVAVSEDIIKILGPGIHKNGLPSAWSNFPSPTLSSLIKLGYFAYRKAESYKRDVETTTLTERL
ncbi:hypothetical protein [Pseudomonas sp. NPDC086251]|uniref:hypothetical protein n=1 Tax=Pseudomonas sp. NPDC086251 TaxID=3364431 RepID=UPI00383676F7